LRNKQGPSLSAPALSTLLCSPPAEGGKDPSLKRSGKGLVIYHFCTSDSSQALWSQATGAAEAAGGTAAPGEFLDQGHNAPVRICASKGVSRTALLEGLNSM